MQTMYGARPGEPVEAIARSDLRRAQTGVREGFSPRLPLPLPSNTIGSMTRAIGLLEARFGTACGSHHQLRTPLLNVLDSLQPHSAVGAFIRALTEQSVAKPVGLPKDCKKYSPKHWG